MQWAKSVKVRSENLSAPWETQPATELVRVWTLMIAMDLVWPSNSGLPLVEMKSLAFAMALPLAKTFATSPRK